MNPGHGRQTTRIGRVRIHESAGDPLLASLHVESLLAVADLTPRMLEPNEILVLRQVRVRLPGWTVRPRSPTMTGAWQILIGQAIDDPARRAFRPASGRVPPDAPAVLFTDESELMVCLARDWMDGLVSGHWWWRALFRDALPEAVAGGAWIQSPQFVPAALAQLASSGDAIRFVRALGDAVAGYIAEATMRAHCVRPALAAQSAPPADPGIDSPSLPDSALPRPPVIYPRSAPHPIALQAAAPGIVARLVPEALAGNLSVAQIRLLTVALGLARAPAELRNAEFLSVLVRWLEAAPKATTADPAGPTPARPPTVEHADAPAKRHPQPDSASHQPVVAGVASSQARPVRTQPPKAGDARLLVVPIDAPVPVGHPAASRHRNRSTLGAPELSGPIEAPPRALLRPMVPAPEPSAPSLVTTATDSAAKLPLRRIKTAFGGLFCLLNAAIALDLYADFTTPDEPGIALSPWDFLALAGERLVGPAMHRDPVWPLLAELAGREAGMRPGAFFAPPSEWRMAPEWLAPFAGGRAAWRWSDDCSRLRVFHPSGFCVLDLARGRGRGRAENQLRREIAALGDAASGPLDYTPDRFAAPDRSPLDRWAGWLMPYLGRRIVLALGRRKGRATMRLLVRRPARVDIGAARIDIRSPLADLPIEVRLAGLDRDPGWIPAAGRFVAFHYD